MKRCALHVHISRLIHVYQGMEKKSSCPPSSDQSKLKGVEFGIATPSNQTPVKTGVSNVKSVAAHGLVADSNLHEARTGTLQDNRLLQDQQASTSSGICHPQNQASHVYICSMNILYSQYILALIFLHHGRVAIFFPWQLAANLKEILEISWSLLRNLMFLTCTHLSSIPLCRSPSNMLVTHLPIQTRRQRQPNRFLSLSFTLH